MVKYQADEIKHEAADLEDPADHDVGETTHTMRKVTFDDFDDGYWSTSTQASRSCSDGLVI